MRILLWLPKEITLTHIPPVVDRVLEVVDQFQDHIYELEQAILLKASMHIVRRRA